MFNPNPPKTLSATANVYTPDEIYEKDIPFPIKEAAKLTHKKHRIFQWFELGSVTGGTGNNQQTITPGLPVGTSQSYDFDQIPDYYTIAISSESAARVFVFIGPNATGIPFRINAGGVITIPSFGQPIITVVCRAGTATAFGTIIGLAGYDELLVGKFSPQ